MRVSNIRAAIVFAGCLLTIATPQFAGALGINNGAYVEVTSGLSPNSLVVATYNNTLTPGQQVDCRIQNGNVQATSSVQSSD
jgi:hypothetical protein